MSDDSVERKRKRPRPSPTRALPASPQSPESSSSTGSSDQFYSLLVAETASGHSVETAVRSLFESLPDDEPLSGRLYTSLAAPVLAALAASPELALDLRTVARMCDAVLTLAEDNIPLSLSRQRLDLGLSSLMDVAKLIDGARNIVVLSGAGVSVSAGIPDFRSKGGLYDTVLERFGLHDPQAIFDLEEFKMDPSVFYSFAKDVMPANNLCPSPTHRFIAELDSRGKLLRNYSQNIDGLERRAGVPEDRVVLCHGSFLTATCMRTSCRAKISGSEIAAEVAAGTVPMCRKCVTPGRENGARGTYDSESEQEMNADDVGVLKPDIVFFGEKLPLSVSDNLEKDVSKADLVLVLGTSLQVAPVARIPQYFGDDVPRILVNRELVGYDFDVELMGDCDVVIEELRKSLLWANEGSGEVEKSPPRNTENGTRVTEGTSLVSRDTGIPVHQRCHKADGKGIVSNDSVAKFRPPRRFLFPGASQHIQDEERQGCGK